jgi:tetratricopeptide (TPR) repeat protein
MKFITLFNRVAQTPSSWGLRLFLELLSKTRRTRKSLNLLCLLCSLFLSFTVLAQQPRSSPLNDDLSRAVALINRGQPEQGIALLNQLAEKSPATPGVEKWLGKAYYQEHNFSAATPHLEAALKQNPHDLEATQLLGLCYYYLNQPAKAIPLIEKVQSSLPHPNPNAAYVLGVSYLQSFEYDKARAAFAQMFSVAPGSAQAYVVLGQMMIHHDLADQAVPELEKALSINAHVPMAHFLLGEVYLFRAQPQEAIEQFSDELAIDPIMWRAYWRMGDAYNRLGKLDEAQRALTRALWLNQDFSAPYIILGQIELKRGDPELAAAYLEHALKMDPNNHDAHYNLGLALNKMGRTAEAQRQFDLSQKPQAARPQ